LKIKYGGSSRLAANFGLFYAALHPFDLHPFVHPFVVALFAGEAKPVPMDDYLSDVLFVLKVILDSGINLTNDH
jgi:hypothetical protein